MKALFTLCSLLALLAGCSTPATSPPSSAAAPVALLPPLPPGSVIPAQTKTSLRAFAPQEPAIPLFPNPLATISTNEISYKLSGYRIRFIHSTDGTLRPYEIYTSTNLINWELIKQGYDRSPAIEIWDFTGRPIGFWMFK